MTEETKDPGVRVYSVCPSGINTKMYRDIHPEVDPKTLLASSVVAEKILELILDGLFFLPAVVWKWAGTPHKKMKSVLK